jgi:hypothetical protein
MAPSAAEACRMHEVVEGYAEGDAQATFIRRIPREAHAVPGWPDHTLLRSLGAVFLSEATPRVVQLGATVYQEGGMDAVVDRLNDDVAEGMGKGRPNKTTKLH